MGGEKEGAVREIRVLNRSIECERELKKVKANTLHVISAFTN